MTARTDGQDRSDVRHVAISTRATSSTAQTTSMMNGAKPREM
jgi:hypothetical protein